MVDQPLVEGDVHQLVGGGNHQLENLLAPILGQGGRQRGGDNLKFIFRHAKFDIMTKHDGNSQPEVGALAQEAPRGRLQQGKRQIVGCTACWSPK